MHKQDRKEILVLATRSIAHNKLRSTLTILGVMIGVAVVIAISSIVNGLNDNVAQTIRSLGANLIFAYQTDPFTLGRPTQELRTRKPLTYSDASAIAGLPHVRAAAPSLRFFRPELGVGSFAVKYGRRRTKNTILEGDTPSWKDVYDVPLARGRWFSDIDDQRREPVIVIGFDTSRELFPTEDPLGKELDLEGQLFTIIGVVSRRTTVFAGGNNPEDNIVIFPWNTFRKIHPELTQVWISIKATSHDAVPIAVDEIRELLRRRRGLPPDKRDNFAVFTQDSLSTVWKQLTGMVFAFMIAISSVGLVVGGIGVMNVMLVSVKERTREIGVRRAMGARKSDILAQFSAEAMWLTAAGGVIGLLIGAAITAAIPLVWTALPARMSFSWGALGFAAALAEGLFFGIYPAWKAANLDPVDALRYE